MQLVMNRSRYGEIKEVFLDGAKGEGERDMQYFCNSWFSLIHQLQHGAVIFPDAGPDTTWIGEESGVAGSTCWSPFNRSNAEISGTDPQYSVRGDPARRDWVPAECDVSTRPGWFWHVSEAPKSAITLLDITTNQLAETLFLLNVPPNSSGLISLEDVQVLQEFSELRKSIFSHNLATNALIVGTSTRVNVLKEDIFTYWAPKKDQPDWVLHLDLQKSVFFNVLHVQGPIRMGQRIAEFQFEILNGEDEMWKTVANSTTVGYQRLLRFPKAESRFLRFVIDKSRADPLISYLGLYMDRFSVLRDDVSDTSRGRSSNNSKFIHHIVVNNSHVATI